MQSYRSKRPSITFLFYLVLFTALLLSFALNSLWFFSFETIRVYVDSISPDGQALNFNRRVFFRIKATGPILFFAGTFLWLQRKPVFKYIEDVYDSTLLLIRAVTKYLSEWFKEENRNHLIIVLFLIGVGIFLRLLHISDPMRYDESFSFIHYGSKPFFYVISNYWYPNNHIFHTITVHFWYLILGDAPWVVRLPALIDGILLMPAIYLTARYIYDKQTALLALMLMATSMAFVDYSTNARGYTLYCLCFLALLTIGKFLKSRSSPSSLDPAMWILFVLIAVIGFYNIPVMLYPFVLVFSWLMIFPAKNGQRLLRQTLLGNLTKIIVLVLVVYVPVIVISGIGSLIGNEFVESKSIRFMLVEIPQIGRQVAEEWNFGIPIILQYFLLIGFLVSVMRSRLSMELFVITIIVLPLLLIFQRVAPSARIWIFLLPLYYMMSAQGISWMLAYVTKKINELVVNYLVILLVLILLSVLVVGNFQVKERLYESELESGLDFVKIVGENMMDGDEIYFKFPSEAIMRFYLQ